jgi:adenosylcobinamide-GDP ribazoletransferase
MGTIKKYDEKTLIASRIMLPFVGLVVGSLAAILFIFISPYLPLSVSILIVMVFLILITGAFHEDALADTADGFGGGSTPEQIITIMKDSRVGTYGALALIISFGLSFSLLSEISNSVLPKIILFSQVAGRFGGLFLMWRLPYVRHDSRFEKAFETYRATISSFKIFLAFLFTLVVGFFLFKEQVFLMLLGIFIIAYLSELYFQKKIGGATGDTFGATIKLGEIFIYFCGIFMA